MINRYKPNEIVNYIVIAFEKIVKWTGSDSELQTY